MAAIPVTFVGMMSYSGLEVGGGPLPPGSGGAPVFPAHPIVLPPAQPPTVWPPAGVVSPPIYYPPTVWPPLPPSGGSPPGIWPSPGHPAHPIYNPPGIWGGGNVPMPTPPIYFPPAPPPGGPPPDGQWVYSPVYGWVWLPSGGGDKPKPPDVPVDPDAPTVTPH
jgi:hypothetical protein